jgi:SnoaL-like domain
VDADAPDRAIVIRLEAQTWTELQLLLGQYCDACDRFDVDDFLACWSADPVLVVDPDVGPPVRGKDALGEFIATTVFPANRRIRMRHFTNAVHIASAAGDVIHLRVGLLMTQLAADGETSILRTLLYEDTVIRESGRWVFAERRQTRDRLGQAS